MSALTLGLICSLFNHFITGISFGNFLRVHLLLIFIVIYCSKHLGATLSTIANILLTSMKQC